MNQIDQGTIHYRDELVRQLIHLNSLSIPINSQNSGLLFINSSITRSLSSRSRASVIENLLRWFFRLNSISYLLCGIDGSNEFGVWIPSVTDWVSKWSLDSIVASPDLSRRQSVVDFELIFSNRSNQDNFAARFHTELRWSHGRFCGSPEAKLYKEFYWRDLPIFRRLV